MAAGIWCEWWVKGLVCPGRFQASGGGEKMPEVGKGNAQQSAGRRTSTCSLGISWDFTRGGVEAGLEEESTGWSQRSVRSGKGAANELPAFASRDAVTQRRCGKLGSCHCQLHLLEIDTLTSVHLHMSQISCFQLRICLQTRCPCHSTPVCFYLSFQYVI